ncbi:hypothetical protein CAPTEDRAFT_218157 [Capitella teleta]|uniref:Uncharacterized protein n=1 Tax=Capitella teleta TaxID=283909 RepID=R7U462_CAPTE|nr:hypothetical protein CAPTEDRAFT_218157 [Capitella teleta]|eukprot:ELT97950.1 hypothetical protein CAPTEDRAFT_218157 [Capitella teleta]
MQAKEPPFGCFDKSSCGTRPQSRASVSTERDGGAVKPNNASSSHASPYINRGNAFKSAFSRGLIEDNHNIDFTAAVGLTELDGMPIVNPLPADTPLEGNRQKKVKLMKTWNILHWISGAKTDRAEEVRTALWWMFFATDRRMWEMKLDSAKEKARQRDAQLETTIANKDAALSDKDAVIEEEKASKKAVIRSIHMPRPGKGREVFAVVFNPSIGHITSIRRTERSFPPRVRELQRSGFDIIGTPARDLPNARYKWKAALTEMAKQSSVRRDRVRNEAKPKSDLNTYRILNGGDLDAVIAAADCDEKEAKWLRGVLADIGITSSNQMRMDKHLVPEGKRKGSDNKGDAVSSSTSSPHAKKRAGADDQDDSVVIQNEWRSVDRPLSRSV